MTPICRLVFLLLILVVKIVRNQELTAEVLNLSLPERLTYTSSVYDGKDAFYIIGGNAGGPSRNTIYKYSLTGGTLTLEGSFPSPRFSGMAVIDDEGEHIYYFGGYELFTTRSEIYQFNLATKATTLVGNLTIPASRHAAVKYKDVTSKVFLIGGSTTSRAIQCWDIDLQSNCPTQNMDTSFSFTSAVSYGNEAFVFGDANRTSYTPVYKLNLDTFQTSYGERTLPNFIDASAAVIAGSNAYIIGGWRDETNFPANSIIQIDLDSLKVTVLTVKNFISNEETIGGVSAVYVEKLNKIYLVGGYSSLNGYRDQILSIDLSPIYVPPTPTTTGPTSTTIDPSLFTCENKPDGFYPHPFDCAQFVGCRNNGITEYYTCAFPLLFNPVKQNCDSPDNVNCEITCVDKADGFYPHPQDCSLFILCNNSVLDVYKCSEPLLFDPIEGKCNFPDLVQCLM